MRWETAPGVWEIQLASNPLSEPQFPFPDEMKPFETADGSHPAQRGLAESLVRPPPAAGLQRSFSAERRRPLLEKDGRTALAPAASAVSGGASEGGSTRLAQRHRAGKRFRHAGTQIHSSPTLKHGPNTTRALPMGPGAQKSKGQRMAEGVHRLWTRGPQ